MTRPKSLADQLVQLAQEKCEFFRTDQEEFFARYNVGDHKETYRLGSPQFRLWIAGIYFARTGSGAPASALDQAIATLSANTRMSGKLDQVHIRVAFKNDAYYIDMGDDKWRGIKVDAEGWKVLKNSSVLFTRSSASRALPYPREGGEFDLLFKFVNIPEEHFIVLLAWMIDCFRPNTSYVGVSISGSQGAAKSTTQDFLKSLIDPMASNRRAKPKTLDDLYVAAHNGHLLSYENLTSLSGDMQNALCIMSTGGSVGSRKFFTDDEEHTIFLKNPVILNGIVNTVSQLDLLDRMLCFELAPVAECIADTELFLRFEKSKPKIFGAVLDRFSAALRFLPVVKSEGSSGHPRMGDFSQLGEAVARSYGEKPGWFLRTYKRIRKGNVDNALDDDPVAVAIRSYLKDEKELSGEFGVLSEALHKHWIVMPGTQTGGQKWPISGKAFSNELRRLEPPLKLVGISIERGKRGGKGCKCTIRKAA